MCFIWEDLDYFENKNYLETLSNKTFGDFYLKLFFLNWANPGLFLFFLVFSIQLTESTNKICQWLDSNCGPLELETTSLPTEPNHCYLKLS